MAACQLSTTSGSRKTILGRSLQNPTTNKTNSEIIIQTKNLPISQTRDERQHHFSTTEDTKKLIGDQFLNGTRRNVVGTSLQQNGFNKKFYKNKMCETMDNTYYNLNTEMPKAQTV